MSHVERADKRLDKIFGRRNQARGRLIRKSFNQFVQSQVTGSIVLLVFTILALFWVNSPWVETYHELLHTEFGLSWGGAEFHLNLHEWINDGLMALFFLVVGLEIKREILVGQLSSFKKAILPVTAAAGGMIVPAAIYLIFNAGGEGARGWGIPMSTDIAFALGILALLGSRVPMSLKVFLTALAIADDMGAVLVIALFYTEQIRLGALLIAGIFLALIFAAHQARIRRPIIYILLAIGVWSAVLTSGIHATVAGILIAMIVPVRARVDPRRFLSLGYQKLNKLRSSELTTDSMLHDEEQLETIIDLHQAANDLRPVGIRMEHNLHPMLVYFVLPLFALFNAGVVLDERIFRSLVNPISIGIILGLVLGKQIGITVFSWIAIRAGWADMPSGITWPQIYAVSWLAGVGFTMSLFVSELAFTQEALVDHAKVGILAASIIAGVIGYVVCSRALPAKETAQPLPQSAS